MRSLVPLVKHYFVTMEEDYNLFKITCQCCNGFVTCKGSSVELICITFLHDRFYTLVLYPEYLDPEIFYFQWPSRTKVQRMYQNLLNEGIGDNKVLGFPDTRKKIEIICS